MDKAEAKSRFQKADTAFSHGRFEESLDELTAIEVHFPDNHRLLNAQARTLERLRRYDEALVLCDRLLDEFHYEKIRPFRDGVAHARNGEAPQPPSLPQTPQDHSNPIRKDTSMSEVPSRFKIKPIRLALLLILCASMYFGYLPLWLGIGLILTYFVGKFILGKAFTRLFSAPFKMKGKALEGAQVEFHGHVWTNPPEDQGMSDDEDDEDDMSDEEEDDEVHETLRYAWIDLTITPQERSEGFTHWEPGELLLLPGEGSIAGLDSLDDAYTVDDVRIVVDGQEVEDEDGKYRGPLRIKILVGLPEDKNEFTLAYYFESLETLRLAP